MRQARQVHFLDLTSSTSKLNNWKDIAQLGKWAEWPVMMRFVRPGKSLPDDFFKLENLLLGSLNGARMGVWPCSDGAPSLVTQSHSVTLDHLTFFRPMLGRSLSEAACTSQIQIQILPHKRLASSESQSENGRRVCQPLTPIWAFLCLTAGSKMGGALMVDDFHTKFRTLPLNSAAKSVDKSSKL